MCYVQLKSCNFHLHAYTHTNTRKMKKKNNSNRSSADFKYAQTRSIYSFRSFFLRFLGSIFSKHHLSVRRKMNIYKSRYQEHIEFYGLRRWHITRILEQFVHSQMCASMCGNMCMKSHSFHKFLP